MKDNQKDRFLFSNTFNSLLKEGIEVDVPVYGYSMFPFFLPGDIVRVALVDVMQLKSGDVVVFKANHKLVLHRLLKVDVAQQCLVCKGDGLIKKDPAVIFENYLGVVKKHYRNSKLIKSTGVTRFLMARISPVAGIVLFFLCRIRNKIISFFNISKL